DNGRNMTYQLSELKSEFKAQVQYAVPAIGLEHDVPFRFILEGLDELPVQEEEPETPEEPEESEDQNDKVLGELITDADETHEVEYITDSPATERNFNNPVTLLMKDGKQYIQMSGTGGQFIKSLTVNGEEVTWGEMNEDGTFVIQFELPGELSDELDFGMVISPPGTEDMEHVVSLSFAGDIPGESDESEDPAEDPEEEPTEEPAEEPEEEPAPEPEEVVEEENLLTPDKAYEI